MEYFIPIPLFLWIYMVYTGLMVILLHHLHAFASAVIIEKADYLHCTPENITVIK